jgi:signal transduction histidine kinase
VRQQQKAVRDAPGELEDGPLDPIRVEQFLALQQSLLAADVEPDTLPGRLVQAVAIFLSLPGAAIGVLRDGLYDVLAVYGRKPLYGAPGDNGSARDAVLAPALAAGRTVVLHCEQANGGGATLILPFRAGETTGALHLRLPDDRVVPDADFELARALAVLTGVALANARQCARLGRIARLKSDALAAMAHDLRAPLNALVGYASLLGEGAFGELSDEQREIAATLERQSIELVDLLGATLDVARLETGQLPLQVEEFSLEELLRGLQAGTFARAARAGTLAFRTPRELPRLRTDRVKVKEIVQNLVDNALKHSGDGAVEVEATAVPDRDTVRITVRDSGPGIAADVLPHLFEPFRPGANSRHGTGFGLYIVRCFVEALGGRVAARSLAGEGTAVTVELPLNAPSRG